MRTSPKLNFDWNKSCSRVFICVFIYFSVRRNAINTHFNTYFL